MADVRKFDVFLTSDRGSRQQIWDVLPPSVYDERSDDGGPVVIEAQVLAVSAEPRHTARITFVYADVPRAAVQLRPGECRDDTEIRFRFPSRGESTVIVECPELGNVRVHMRVTIIRPTWMTCMPEPDGGGILLPSGPRSLIAGRLNDGRRVLVQWTRGRGRSRSDGTSFRVMESDLLAEVDTEDRVDCGFSSRVTTVPRGREK